jgi:hypothetical protein
VKGSGLILIKDDLLKIPWKNISTETFTFIPKISFENPDRQYSCVSGM